MRKHMKKKILITIFFFVLINHGFSDTNLLSINLDWQLGIRFGFEHHFNHRLGIKEDIGIAIPGILTADTFIIINIYSLNPYWQFNICPGISNILTPIGANAFMIAPGVSIMIRHRLSRKLNFDFRFGEGFPLFFEKGKAIIRHIGLPFGLWPDISLGISFNM